jgi:protein-L-isoaspartate(D-aspartate) O-methyltransferase
MNNSIDRARFNMIQQQIRPWNITDERVLSVMAEVPRELFVPDAYRGLAYADIEIPIAEGQTMLAPKLVAHMLQALDIRDGDEVLEIGTGTGYVTACLAGLGGRVTSMEIHASLAEQARETLAALDAGQIEVRVGNGLEVLMDAQPFDAIAVTGSLPDSEALQVLKEQLSPGGRLFAVVGEDPVMEAMLMTRLAGTELSTQTLFETSVPALEKSPEPERFVF